MTPQEIRQFILDSPKPHDWINTEAYTAWRKYIEGLWDKYGRKTWNDGSSADDVYQLALSGADAEEITHVFALLFL